MTAGELLSRCCKGCGRDLPETDFAFCRGRGSKKKLYRRRTCRACVRAATAEQRKEYEEKNRQRLLEYHRDWMAEWRKNNPEAHREVMRRTYIKNKDVIKSRVAARRERVVAARRGVITQSKLLEKAAYWGNRCWMCGSDHEEWDHVKPLALGGLHVLANLRPSCRHCNRVKGKRVIT